MEFEVERMSSNLEKGEESEYHFERLFNVSWPLEKFTGIKSLAPYWI